MIRQFTIQMVSFSQIDMKGMLEKYANDNSTLLNRIQELEEEISRLKNTTY
jgi:hypothetical protein